MPNWRRKIVYSFMFKDVQLVRLSHSVYQFAEVATTNATHQWLKQQEFNFSQFWRYKVQNWGKFSFWGFPPLLSDRWLVSPCALPPSLPRPWVVCILISSFYKDPSHAGLGHTRTISFYLSYIFKGPITKHSLMLKYFSVKTSRHTFWRDTIQPITNRVSEKVLFSAWNSWWWEEAFLVRTLRLTPSEPG